MPDHAMDLGGVAPAHVPEEELVELPVVESREAGLHHIDPVDATDQTCGAERPCEDVRVAATRSTTTTISGSSFFPS